MRSVKEWIGKTDDTPVPPRVRLRVWERYRGKCHRCKRKIFAGESWTCEHVIALANKGENREKNLNITCAWCLPGKNAEDVAEKSKTYARKAKHIGVKKPRSIRSWRKFDGTPIYAGRER